MSKNQQAVERLLGIMESLRHPEKGCPWDIKQTFETIVPHTIEETYEVVDAIENQQWTQLRDELGDLLFQIVFYSQLGKEQGLFDFADVAEAISDKLERRHPHVFGEEGEQSPGWEQIKAEERQEKSSGGEISILDDVPAAFPALTRAAKLQKRCASVGFDWDSLGPVAEKVSEELQEVMEEATYADVQQERVEEELGDLLFAVVNLSRHLSCNPEQALRKANKKFESRFRKIETKVRESERTLAECSLDELDSLWNTVKSEEKVN
ncbi:nucleoside triphosphate pyrophosphohydrolase [Parasalinivibrio latis]|uniref:nucleoside triphosphate pyrophosphohydrolase n=1 Tax=Parasalinivibrio latis TaxID=2952610 RepID=UPI0030E1C766